ncbi:MAG: ABC transporter substrate-binding protein [Verrucomicrobiota bacterium]
MQPVTPLLIILLFGGLSPYQTRALDQVSFQPDWFPNGQFAGFFAAQENALYAEHSLKVQLNTFSFGTDFLERVAHNEAQFGTAEAYILVNAIARGQPLVALGAVLKKSPAGYLYLKKSGIYSAKDFSNKRVGIHAYAEELLPYFLRKAKIDARSVTPVKVQNDIQMLIRGEIDLLQGYAIDEFLELQRLTTKPAGFITFEALGLPMYSMVIYTSRTFAEENPETIANFMTATAEGWQHALNHPEDSAKTLSKQAYNKATPLDHLEEQINALRPFILQPDQEILKTDRAFWEGMLHSFLESKLIKQPIDLDTLLWEG